MEPKALRYHRLAGHRIFVLRFDRTQIATREGCL